jgi:nitroimidazol reductase NimA-like FMN-containing flavoprotein (pyridoxamine 5'-phosphate oxidase superfamily)
MLVQTPRTTLKRRPMRGSFDRALIHSILDEALVCHIGFMVDEQPFVVPTTYARVDDRLYIHGAVANRMLRNLATGVPMCFTVTLLDGLVLARSAFHHSMNYRSVMVFGTGREVTDFAERYRAFEAVVNHIMPNRFEATRAPDEQEIKATNVIALDITEASAKVRTGPVSDAEEDYALPYWAGVLPLKLVAQEPVPDERLPPGTPVPAEVRTYRRPTRERSAQR